MNLISRSVRKIQLPKMISSAERRTKSSKFRKQQAKQIKGKAVSPFELQLTAHTQPRNQTAYHTQQSSTSLPSSTHSWFIKARWLKSAGSLPCYPSACVAKRTWILRFRKQECFVQNPATHMAKLYCLTVVSEGSQDLPGAETKIWHRVRIARRKSLWEWTV